MFEPRRAAWVTKAIRRRFAAAEVCLCRFAFASEQTADTAAVRFQARGARVARVASTGLVLAIQFDRPLAPTIAAVMEAFDGQYLRPSASTTS